MAIYSVAIDFEGSRSSSINDKFEKVLRRSYLVTADRDDDEEYVRTHLGISLFDGHPSDSFARARSIGVEYKTLIRAPDLNASTPCALWLATVEWGYINPFEAQASGDPTDCPIEVVIEGVNEEKVADVDINGKPVVNSAGDPFDPPIPKDEQRVVIKIAQNIKTLTLDQILSYANTVNEGPFQGRDAKTVKMSQPRVTPKFSQFLSVIYYRVEWTLEYNRDGWKSKPLDQGFRSLDQSVSPPQFKTLLDRYGLETTAPMLLDGNGQALALPVTKDNVVFLDFDIYPTANFDALGFPENIFVTNPYV